MNSGLPIHDIVLLGVGHTNAYALRMWRTAPIPQARLTCVSDFYQATYSGMLPGTLAGLYPPERMQIDLARLCAAAGARLIRDTVVGLDIPQRRVLFADRPPLPFDILSIGIGSQPRTAGVELDDSVLPIKPMQTFLARLDERLRQLVAATSDRPLQLAVVGAGAGGVEIALCLPPRLERVLPGRAYELALIDSGQELATSLPANTAAAVRDECKRRGVKLLLGQAVVRIRDGVVQLADGTQQPADLVLWTTGAAPPPLLGKPGLPTDAEGFLLRRETLQTTADAPIFIVGDSGVDPDHPAPKAGVYAVRQGPVLWGNLHRLHFGRPLLKYTPQRGFLSLLATGDGRAILSYKGLTFRGRWCWQLKKYIDARFVDMYQDYSPAAPPSNIASDTSSAPQAEGLQPLGLTRVDPSSPFNLADIAVLHPPADAALAATIDLLPEFLNDPYLVGRVAALSAASRLWDSGVRPTSALAIAMIPTGPQPQRQQLLDDLLAGGRRELQAMGVTLAGGRATEGPQTAIGFAMLGQTPVAGAPGSPQDSGLQPGDVIVLTKPLGSGVLLTAHRMARCSAAWLEELLALLLSSNQSAAAAADEFNVHAALTVANRGLAGCLLDMFAVSQVAVDLKLADVPLLTGVAPLIKAGIESTSAIAHLDAEAFISVSPENRQLAQYAALFDPQISGGLLLAAPSQHADALINRLSALAPCRPAIVGNVVEYVDERMRVRVV